MVPLEETTSSEDELESQTSNSPQNNPTEQLEVAPPALSLPKVLPRTKLSKSERNNIYKRGGKKSGTQPVSPSGQEFNPSIISQPNTPLAGFAQAINDMNTIKQHVDLAIIFKAISQMAHSVQTAKTPLEKSLAIIQIIFELEVPGDGCKS